MKKTTYKTDQNNPAIQAYKDAIQKGEKNQHILPQGKGWIVKNLNSDQVSPLFNTQEEALKYAESFAASGTAIFTHDTDGRIQQRKDY